MLKEPKNSSNSKITTQKLDRKPRWKEVFSVKRSIGILLFDVLVRLKIIKMIIKIIFVTSRWSWKWSYARYQYCYNCRSFESSSSLRDIERSVIRLWSKCQLSTTALLVLCDFGRGVHVRASCRSRDSWLARSSKMAATGCPCPCVSLTGKVHRQLSSDRCECSVYVESPRRSRPTD